MAFAPALLALLWGWVPLRAATVSVSPPTAQSPASFAGLPEAAFFSPDAGLGVDFADFALREAFVRVMQDAPAPSLPEGIAAAPREVALAALEDRAAAALASFQALARELATGADPSSEELARRSRTLAQSIDDLDLLLLLVPERYHGFLETAYGELRSGPSEESHGGFPAMRRAIEKVSWLKLADVEAPYAEGVRLFVSADPRLGHQRATFALAQRLRGLGYPGPIEAVYQDASKVAVLDAIPGLGLSFRSLEDFSRAPTRVRLALTGGADALPSPLALYHSNWADAFFADAFLRLGPLGWDLYRDELYLKGESGPRDISGLTAGRALVFRPSALEDITAAYLDALDPARFPPDKVWGLKSLLARVRGHELLPAYGLHYFKTESVHRVLLGLSTALDERPELFERRGVVVPLLGDDNRLHELRKVVADPADVSVSRGLDDLGLSRRAAVLAANERLKSRLLFMSIADPRLGKALDGLARGQILVLDVGPVPPPVFEALFGESTLPPFLEGKNTLNLAGLLGIPFLPNNRTKLEDLAAFVALDPAFMSFPDVSGTARHIMELVAYTFGYEFEAVARYLIAARDPRSALRRMFRDGRIPQDDPSRDKLSAALKALP